MKFLIQLLRAVLTLVWALVMVAGVRLYLNEAVAGNQPPQLAGHGLWSVTDARMEPAYRAGDLVLVEMGKPGQPGDPVLAKSTAGLELSRIIGTSEGQFILKPDGAEESVLAGPEAVAGVCGWYLPGLAGAAEFLRSLLGLGIIFLVGLALIFLPGRLTGEEGERPKRYQPKHRA